MKDYKIGEIRYGETDGGMACGPVGGNPIAEAQFTAKDGEAFHVSLVDVDGIPVFLKTNVSTIDDQLEYQDYDGYEDFWEELDTHNLQIDDYSEVFEMDDDDEMKQICRCLIYILQEKGKCDFEDKYFSEFEMPVSDREQDWIEEESYLEDEE